MKLVRLFTCLLFAMAASASHAGLMNVSSITITSSAPTWLQIAEVIALETGTGADLALTSAGATAVGSVYNGGAGGNSPDKAIDGTAPSDYPNIFHSATPGAGESLVINLAAPSELDSLEIFGRNGCCTGRDIFDIELFDVAGASLFSVSAVSAVGQPALVMLPESRVPAPGILALLGVGLLSLRVSRKHTIA